MFGSIDDSADIFILEALHNFRLFVVFHIQLIDFEVVNVIGGVGCYTKLINLDVFGLFVIFLIKHVDTFEFLQMNGDKFVFMECVFSDNKKVSLRGFYRDNFSFGVNLPILLYFACYSDLTL